MLYWITRDFVFLVFHKKQEAKIKETQDSRKRKKWRRIVQERRQKKEEACRLRRWEAFSAVLVKTLHLRLLSKLVSDLTAEPGVEDQTLPPMKTSEKATDTIAALMCHILKLSQLCFQYRKAWLNLIPESVVLVLENIFGRMMHTLKLQQRCYSTFSSKIHLQKYKQTWNNCWSYKNNEKCSYWNIMNVSYLGKSKSILKYGCLFPPQNKKNNKK